MLTRLQVSGFKNLVDVDVRFGPFTCIAGANGSGKSNLFDAIRFLSNLANLPLLDAALSVRDERGRSGDVRNLFHRVGDQYDDRMTFVAEMIVPPEGEDDLGQTAKATITFLRYSLALGFRESEEHLGPGTLEILKEELSHIKQMDAPRHLLFPHTASTWRKSAVKGRRTVPHFISTEGESPERVIKLHQDKGTGGRTSRRPAESLPRTILSVVNAAESPTATLARNEMKSWRLLQLEPSSLRKPSAFASSRDLGADGSNLAATVYRLTSQGSEPGSGKPGVDAGPPNVYARIANRLSELIDDVRDVHVDPDVKRQLFTLFVTGRDGTSHPAMALSDGTLRFLALTVLELDPTATGLLCLEEPENGIHPERIPAMLRLLDDIATDPTEETGDDNPLRQVIVNTHSPAVVGETPDEDLIVAELAEKRRADQLLTVARFSALPDTWRANAGTTTLSRGKLLAYLNPHLPPGRDDRLAVLRNRPSRRRVVDRPDLHPYLPFP